MFLYAILKVLETVKGWLYAPQQLQQEEQQEQQQEQEQEQDEQEQEQEQGPVKRYNLRERKPIDYQG
jgi:hypothetical protein